MTLFTASIQTVTLRFFLMMGVVIASIASGFYFLTFLALPIFLSAMMVISFTAKTKKDTSFKKMKTPKQINTAA